MTYPNTTENMIQNILLEKMKFQVNQVLSKNYLNAINYNVEKYLDYASESMIYQLKVNIFGEKKKFPINIPKSWFQMFKEGYYPKWLLKKYPVQYKDLGILELYHLYPHIKSSIPEEKHYIYFSKFEMMK